MLGVSSSYRQVVGRMLLSSQQFWKDSWSVISCPASFSGLVSECAVTGSCLKGHNCKKEKTNKSPAYKFKEFSKMACTVVMTFAKVGSETSYFEYLILLYCYNAVCFFVCPCVSSSKSFPEKKSLFMLKMTLMSYACARVSCSKNCAFHCSSL